MEKSWKDTLSRDQRKRWQIAMIGFLKLVITKGHSFLFLWLFSIFYRRNMGNAMDACEILWCHWMISKRLAACLGVLSWDLQEKYGKLIKHGMPVWRLIEALEGIEREEVQTQTEDDRGIILEDTDIWDPEG